MQMLLAAGMNVLWDRLPNRQPWNVRGFYEWADPSKLTLDHHGMAVKVMANRLENLPDLRADFAPDSPYRFICLLRNPACVEESMAHCASMRGKEMSDAHNAAKWQQFALGYISNFPHIIVGFNELFDGTGPEKIGKFLNRDSLEVAKMKDCVDPEMWHFKPQ
jgi:hypothetical protein